MAKPVAKSSAQDTRKSGKAKDLSAKSLKADKAASVKGGVALSQSALKINKATPTFPKVESFLKFSR